MTNDASRSRWTIQDATDDCLYPDGELVLSVRWDTRCISTYVRARGTTSSLEHDGVEHTVRLPRWPTATRRMFMRQAGAALTRLAQDVDLTRLSEQDDDPIARAYALHALEEGVFDLSRDYEDDEDDETEDE